MQLISDRLYVVQHCGRPVDPNRPLPPVNAHVLGTLFHIDLIGKGVGDGWRETEVDPVLFFAALFLVALFFAALVLAALFLTALFFAVLFFTTLFFAGLFFAALFFADFFAGDCFLAILSPSVEPPAREIARATAT